MVCNPNEEKLNQSRTWVLQYLSMEKTVHLILQVGGWDLGIPIRCQSQFDSGTLQPKSSLQLLIIIV